MMLLDFTRFEPSGNLPIVELSNKAIADCQQVTESNRVFLGT